MTSRITLFGATGYTGGLVLEALLRQGVRPTIAGRNPAALTALAEDSGGLDHVVVDAARPDDLRKHLGHGDVLITTVGPFERYGFPVAQAAADAGAHYLDSTGEVGFVRALHARHHQRARETWRGDARRPSATTTSPASSPPPSPCKRRGRPHTPSTSATSPPARWCGGSARARAPPCGTA